MKKIITIAYFLALPLCANAQEQDIFSCTMTLNDIDTFKVEPHLEDKTTGFFEYVDNYYSENHVKISYYPGIGLVILKVYDKTNKQTYLKNYAQVTSGKYSLTVEDKSGIFGNSQLIKIVIDCILNLEL